LGNFISKLLCLAFILCVGHGAKAQDEEKKFRGILRATSDGSPVSFAVISNPNLEIATVSGADGYFEIAVEPKGDTIVVKVIGYKTTEIFAQASDEVKSISIEEAYQQLSEIEVFADISDQLAKVINECKKNFESEVLKSKAFFQLKSAVNGKQVELVETYNNATIWGGDVTSLGLKTGRIGLSSFDLGYWVSTGISRSMQMEKTTDSNENYPLSPLQRSLGKMKKEWRFSLENVYVESNGDSVYVITAKPREFDEERFNAKFWVNKKKTIFLKLELQLDSISKHPFQPLFPSDTIQNLNLRVSKNFVGENKSHLDLVEFDADIFYLNREGVKYKVDIQSFIYCYDWDSLFVLPFYDIEAIRNSDYRMISAIPHNSLFWEKYKRFSKAEIDSSGDVFYNTKAELTNRSMFTRSDQMKMGFFEQAYFKWSPKKRLRLNVVTSPAPNNTRLMNMHAFSFRVLAFYDLNVFDDTTQVLSATTIDPFNTYWDRPYTTEADAFFNIYTDLIEMKRREIHADMLRNPTPDRMKELYERYQYEATLLRTRYFREVGAGIDQKMLRKWNDMVLYKLNIDNMKVFGIE
jgi:hypothetical protein